MKKLSPRFLKYLFVFIVIAAVLMIIFQLVSIFLVSKNFYSEYSVEALDNAIDSTEYLSFGNLSYLNILINLDFEDEEYVNRIINGYLISGLFNNLYAFDKNNKSIYLSDYNYGINCSEIVLNLCDNHSPSNYDNLIYSRKSNSFVRPIEKIDEEGNYDGFFLFVNNIENFDNLLFSNYEIGSLYIIDEFGDVLYPLNGQNEVHFNYTKCFNDEKIKYNGILKYKYNNDLNKCFFFAIGNDEIIKKININREIISITTTMLCAFILILFIFHVLRREF